MCFERLNQYVAAAIQPRHATDRSAGSLSLLLGGTERAGIK